MSHRKKGARREKADIERGGTVQGRRWWEYSLVPYLAFLLLSTGLLYAVLIPVPHTGGDNAGYLTLAYSLVEGMGYRELWDPALPLHTKYPPVFPLLLGGMILAGATTWVAFKLFILLTTAGALLFVLIWAAGRRGLGVGLAIALLTLLSSGWLDASRWVLSEPVFLLFSFLALSAAERGERANHPSGRVAAGPGSHRLVFLAGGAALLALLTRSAGLPLVLALLGGLLYRRALRPAAILGGAFAVLSGWWFLRARGGTSDGAYQSEFWMVNPYEPERGEIGWVDLPFRVFENLRIYLVDTLPSQWWGGAPAGGALLLGLLLGGGALWGWILRIRSREIGVAELFLPLYAGIIFLWPPVWSGERFLLPLIPVVLLLAGEALWAAGSALGRARIALPTVAFLLLALPALSGWMAMAAEGAGCRRIAASGDPFLCHPEGVREYRDAAVWMGANLAEGAVVMNRKPRLLYVFDGPPGVVFPFTTEPDLFFAEADRVGARYLLLDHLDGISPYYLPELIRARPLAFCHIRGWGGAGGMDTPTTELFGILPATGRRDGGEVGEIRLCGPSYMSQPGVEPPTLDGGAIPLFIR